MTATETPATPDEVTARAPEGPLDLHHGIGLYIHIPFCATKCTYCDFNTFAGIEPLMPAVVDALETELRLWATRSDTSHERQRAHPSRCRTLHHLASGTRPARSLAAAAGRTGTAGDAGSGTGRSTGATCAGSARIIRRQFWWALDAAVAQAYDSRRSRHRQGPLRNHRKSGCRSGQCSPPIDEGPLRNHRKSGCRSGQCPPTTDESPLRNHRKPGCRSGQCPPTTDESPVRNHRKSGWRSGQCPPPTDESPLRNHCKPGCRGGRCSPPIDKGPLSQSAGFSSIEGQCSPPIEEAPL